MVVALPAAFSFFAPAACTRTRQSHTHTLGAPHIQNKNESRGKHTFFSGFPSAAPAAFFAFPSTLAFALLASFFTVFGLVSVFFVVVLAFALVLVFGAAVFFSTRPLATAFVRGFEVLALDLGLRTGAAASSMGAKTRGLLLPVAARV